MNATIPKAPRLGDRLSATQMSQVVAAIRRYMPIAGSGIRVSHTMGGTVIAAKPSGKGSSSTAISKTLPFTCATHTSSGSGSEGSEVSYAFFLPDHFLHKNGYNVGVISSTTRFDSESTPLDASAWCIFNTLELPSNSDFDSIIWCLIRDDVSSPYGHWRYQIGVYSDSAFDNNSELLQFGYENRFPICRIKQELDSEGNISRKIQQYTYGNMEVNDNKTIAPFTCEYARQTTWESGNSGSSGWAFYLPDEMTLHYKGKDVSFSDVVTSFASEQGDSSWKIFNITGSDGATIYCNIHADSSSEGTYYATMSDSADSGSGVEMSFPVAMLQMDSSGTYETGYRAFQFAFGYMDLAEGGEDLGTFRYEGGESASLTNCYYRTEQMVHSMSDVAVDSAWAGNFVWLNIDSSGSGSMSYGTLGAMQSDISLDSKSVIPLYKFDSSCKVEIDLRSIPTAQEWMNEIAS